MFRRCFILFVLLSLSLAREAFYNLLQHHGRRTDNPMFHPIRYFMACSVQCTNEEFCVAFDVCQSSNDVMCALLYITSSVPVDLFDITGKECKYFVKEDTFISTSSMSSSAFITNEVIPSVSEASVICESSSNGYTLVEELRMCYKVNFTRSTWSTANITCIEEGARLLMLHTEERWLFWNTIAPSIDDLTYGFWIGGNDLDVEGQWKWSDGSLFTDHAFIKWGKMYHGFWTYEPDNYGGLDNCLRFYKAVHPHYPAYPETEYTWHDDWCEASTLYFICEIPLN